VRMQTHSEVKVSQLRIKSFAVMMVLGVSLAACNRAGLRFAGASLPFPEVTTQYVAKKNYPYGVVVAMPTDLRADHYGEQVAGTSWTGCRTDTFAGDEAMTVIHNRLAAELTASKLFANVRQGKPGAGDLLVRSEVHAFCSQVVGFIYGRVAGITALDIVVERDGKPLFKQKFERVVTDADSEYTGSQIGYIEQGMRWTMTDSLRELIRDLLVRLEREAGDWSS